MYRSVLVPTDGSQEMAAVVNQAIELASLCDAKIHVLHVVDERAYLSRDIPCAAGDVQDLVGRIDANRINEVGGHREEVLADLRIGAEGPDTLHVF